MSAQSSSNLASITNKGLQQVAADLGHRVEVRPIEFSEVASFAEVAACDTAVVITPANEIVRGDKVIQVGPREGCGPAFEEICTCYRAIQIGDVPDPCGRTVPEESSAQQPIKGPPKASSVVEVTQETPREICKCLLKRRLLDFLLVKLYLIV